MKNRNEQLPVLQMGSRGLGKGLLRSVSFLGISWGGPYLLASLIWTFVHLLWRSGDADLKVKWWRIVLTTVFNLNILMHISFIIFCSPSLALLRTSVKSVYTNKTLYWVVKSEIHAERLKCGRPALWICSSIGRDNLGLYAQGKRPQPQFSNWVSASI